MGWKSNLPAIHATYWGLVARLPTSRPVTRAKVVLVWSVQSVLATRGVFCRWVVLVESYSWQRKGRFGRRLSRVNIIISHKEIPFFRKTIRTSGSLSVDCSWQIGPRSLVIGIPLALGLCLPSVDNHDRQDHAIALEGRYNRSCPLRELHRSDHVLFDYSLSSSASIFCRRAYRTDRALQKRGWASESMISLAVTPFTIPRSGLKTSVCLSTTPCTASCVCVLKVVLQSSCNLDNQFLPSKLGPLALTAMHCILTPQLLVCGLTDQRHRGTCTPPWPLAMICTESAHPDTRTCFFEICMAS